MLKYERVPNIITSDVLKCVFCGVGEKGVQELGKDMEDVIASLCIFVEDLLTIEEDWDDSSFLTPGFLDRLGEHRKARRLVSESERTYVTEITVKKFEQTADCRKEQLKRR